MATGTVKFVNNERGFGFITPSDGQKDVFLHVVQRRGRRVREARRRPTRGIRPGRGPERTRGPERPVALGDGSRDRPRTQEPARGWTGSVRAGIAPGADGRRPARPSNCRLFDVSLIERAAVPTSSADEAGGAHDFRALAVRVRGAGLMDRRLRYYWVKLVVTVAAFAAGWVGFFLIGASWANLGVAVFLGVMSTQIGFLGHDAGHGQIFETRRANRRLGLGIGNVLIGLSFGWWVPKHNAHHAHPNQVNRDPDIEVPAGGGAGTDGGRLPRLSRCLATRQAELFVPLMLLRSTGLYVSGAQHLLRRRDRAAVTECVLLAAHFAFYLTVVLWVLPLPEAAAFIAVHQAVFSLYLGCSFAPNHKGMPILDEDSSLGFARRQVVTARNVVGGVCTGFILGGLNYQIEHHLFPTMPRPNLARAQDLVRAFCLESGLGYCEMSPLRSYRQVLRGLKLGGSGALRPLDSLALTQ